MVLKLTFSVDEVEQRVSEALNKMKDEVSKFKELCSAYHEFRDQLSDARNNAFDMSKRVAFYYKQYLGLDNEGAFKLIPLDERVRDDLKYSPAGATHLGDDGFWYLGVELTVYKNKNTYPQQPFLVRFKFLRKEDGSYLLNVDGLNAASIITDMDDATQFSPVFDKVQENILGYFNENLKFLKGKHNKMSSIGFIQSDLATTINNENNG
ncbi:hypothetical protein PHA77_14525 [Edwardsiella tarda]|uniref:hypothetical protein n=1 Tax=Edwardsiella tarda TaxID=636 RepID=UPI002443C745|nr:hypothetical protein [Edwardsiella tarda]WGE28662.1 hypothetical protein PHA77_14525 [Edwardsiella tarda]